MLHFCQAQRSVAESIPVVEVAAKLDQDLFRLVVAKKEDKGLRGNPFPLGRILLKICQKHIFHCFWREKLSSLDVLEKDIIDAPYL